MRYLITFLIISTGVISCVKKSTTSIQSNNFSGIISFISTDLSEDAQHVSTKDDEIFIIYGTIFCDDQNNIINAKLAYHLEEKVIKNTTYKLKSTPDSLTTTQNFTAYYFIGLGEYDDNVSKASLALTGPNFVKSLSGKTLSNIREEWNKTLKQNNPYHDNLGIFLQNKQHIHTDPTISGKQLEDSYHYLFKGNFYSSTE